ANWDVSFLVGLLVLAGAVLGRALDGKSADWLVASASPPAPGGESSGELTGPIPVAIPTMKGVLILSVCALFCLVNPFTYEAYGAAIRPFVQIFQDSGDILTQEQLSFFGKAVRDQFPSDWVLLAAYYLIVVSLGLGSFVLNLTRFSW